MTPKRLLFLSSFPDAHLRSCARHSCLRCDSDCQRFGHAAKPILARDAPSPFHDAGATGAMDSAADDILDAPRTFGGPHMGLRVGGKPVFLFLFPFLAKFFFLNCFSFSGFIASRFSIVQVCFPVHPPSPPSCPPPSLGLFKFSECWESLFLGGGTGKAFLPVGRGSAPAVFMEHQLQSETKDSVCLHDRWRQKCGGRCKHVFFLCFRFWQSFHFHLQFAYFFVCFSALLPDFAVPPPFGKHLCFGMIFGFGFSGSAWLMRTSHHPWACLANFCPFCHTWSFLPNFGHSGSRWVVVWYS